MFRRGHVSTSTVRLQREIVAPSTMTPDRQAEFAARLFEVHSVIFAGVSKDEFLAMVVAPVSLSTRIEVFRNEKGQIVGYCAVHRYAKKLRGIRCSVFRVQTGLLPAHRRAHSTIAFLLAEAVRHRLLHPFHRTYLLLSPVHPSSYRLLAELLPTVYPNWRYEVPAEVLSLMTELAEAMGMPSPVNPDTPLVRAVGWRTLDTEEAARLWAADPRPDVRFYIAANPGYRQGHGLLTLAPLTIANVFAALARHAGHVISRKILRSAPTQSDGHTGRTAEPHIHTR